MNGSGGFGVTIPLEYSGQIRFFAECVDSRDSASKFTTLSMLIYNQGDIDGGKASE